MLILTYDAGGFIIVIYTERLLNVCIILIALLYVDESTHRGKFSSICFFHYAGLLLHREMIMFVTKCRRNKILLEQQKNKGKTKCPDFKRGESSISIF